jgi:GT2 family glycosyltransferase
VASQQLSIVIINWNSWPDLQRCLASLRVDEAADVEVVIVDNGSTDGSVQNLARAYPTARVHVNSTNVGHTRAVNQGFRRVQGTHVLLLDADTELERGSVERMLGFLADRPDVSVVGPRTYNPDGSIQETARNFPSFMSGLFGRHSLLTRLFPNNRFSRRYLLREKLGAAEPFQVEQVCAACMLFRRSLLEEVGLWDEGYEGYWVDVDWFMQLKKLGKKVFCVPEAKIVHQETYQPGKRKSIARIWMFHRGAYRLYRKHFTWGVLDPRALFAWAALHLRAALLSAWEQLRSSTVSEPGATQPLGQVVPRREEILQ